VNDRGREELSRPLCRQSRNRSRRTPVHPDGRPDARACQPVSRPP